MAPDYTAAMFFHNVNVLELTVTVCTVVLLLYCLGYRLTVWDAAERAQQMTAASQHCDSSRATTPMHGRCALGRSLPRLPASDTP
jgi:hypothetical protein